MLGEQANILPRNKLVDPAAARPPFSIFLPYARFYILFFLCRGDWGWVRTRDLVSKQSKLFLGVAIIKKVHCPLQTLLAIYPFHRCAAVFTIEYDDTIFAEYIRYTEPFSTLGRFREAERQHLFTLYSVVTIAIMRS